MGSSTDANIRILVDTNIALTYVSGREDRYSASSEQVMRLCAEEKVMGFLAFHSLSIIWYVTRKIPENKRREWLRQLCEMLIVIGATQDEVLAAIDRDEFSDFEDCLQDKCAKTAGCDYIVTANIKDYDQSEIKAVSPDDFIKLALYTVNGGIIAST